MNSLISKLEGPPRGGQGSNGQYVYWICMAYASDQTIARGAKTPADFDRKTFCETVVQGHKDCKVEIVETVCFREPHADGRPHLNLLVRAKSQYRWLKVAKRLLQHYKIYYSNAHGRLRPQTAIILCFSNRKRIIIPLHTW